MKNKLTVVFAVGVLELVFLEVVNAGNFFLLFI